MVLAACGPRTTTADAATANANASGDTQATGSDDAGAQVSPVAGQASVQPIEDGREDDAQELDVALNTMRCAQMVEGESRATNCDYPADVLAFIDQRALCDHWRGEPMPEASEEVGADPEAIAALHQRRDQIVDAIAETCHGTDDVLVALKARHRGDAHALRLLEAFEPIER